MEDTRLVEGIVIDKDFSHPQVRRLVAVGRQLGGLVGRRLGSVLSPRFPCLHCQTDSLILQAAKKSQIISINGLSSCLCTDAQGAKGRQDCHSHLPF